jgi:two-component sensor histidine kinase
MQQEAGRRLQQRELLADIGACALKTSDIDSLLQEACRLVAAGLEVRFCKVLEYLAAENRLLVRAGVGWREGVVGHAKLEADTGSPAGYALQTGQPVISQQLSAESRFRTPQLLIEHGIASAMNVIVRGEASIFGVLEADSGRSGVFEAEDIAYMQAAANLLGVAIERARNEAELRQALESRDLLLREVDHRVKNSLQLVASLLAIQRSRLSDPEAAGALDEAIARVRAVAETHRALYQSADLRNVALGRLLRDLCRQMGKLNASVTIDCSTDDDLVWDAERALPLGLIVSELLTNAVRHAYPAEQTGVVQARAAEEQGMLEIVISDTGIGLPPEPQGGQRGLGTTIIRALARQVGAELDVQSRPGQGTSTTIRVPRAVGGDNS